MILRLGDPVSSSCAGYLGSSRVGASPGSLVLGRPSGVGRPGLRASPPGRCGAVGGRISPLGSPTGVLLSLPQRPWGSSFSRPSSGVGTVGLGGGVAACRFCRHGAPRQRPHDGFAAVSVAGRPRGTHVTPRARFEVLHWFPRVLR